MRQISILVFVMLALVANAQKQKKSKKTDSNAAPVTEQAKPQQQVAQTDEKKDTAAMAPQFNPLIMHYVRKNTLAERWNDAEVGKEALYDLIAENPGNDSLIYNLAVIYFESQRFISSALIAQDLLTNNPKNVPILQLAASSYESLGLLDKALASYETIYLQNSNTAVLFKMAQIQFELKKFPESTTNIEILLTKADLASLTVTLSDSENKKKDYPLKASILNLKGLLAQQAGDKVNARKAFTEALGISPDFPLAKQNLAKLK